MKTQLITGEGVCGMQINLNVLDQHVVTQLVKDYDRFIKAKEAHDKWDSDYWNDAIRYKVDPETGEKTKLWNNRDEYRKLYEEPEVPYFDNEETLKTIMVFLRKLVSKSDLAATIFSEEDEK